MKQHKSRKYLYFLFIDSVIKVLFAFALAGLSVSACAPVQTVQPTHLPSPTDTALPLSTETPALLVTLTPEPTETQTPIATLTPLPTETPVDLSNLTDAMIENDRIEAFKAAKTLISSLPNASQEEIAEVMVKKWLAYYTGAQVDAYLRLKDYKFEQVKIMGNCPRPKNTVKFAFGAGFSVQSVTEHPGDWVAGGSWDLTLEADHWISHSAHTFSITASNGFYILKGEGIPPCSNP